MSVSVINPDPLYDQKEASEYVHLPGYSLGNMRYQGRGPNFLKLGGRVMYRRSALDAWLNSCEVNIKAKG